MVSRVSRVFFFLLALSLLGGCAHFSSPTNEASDPPARDQQDELRGEPLGVRALEIAPPDLPPAGRRIPMEVNPMVNKWISYFQGRGRHHMVRYLGRSTRYLDLMKTILRERGMPEELIYVPLIESGFSSRALSHASAVGYWQFIRGTGRRYNLRIDEHIDERRDPVLSTEAAASYLASLYSLFGDWYLALAAYNAGENRIQRAVMKHQTRDFWMLAKGRRLPAETRNYVPKFIAAALIYENPEVYGFTELEYQEPLRFDVVETQSPISLMSLAEKMNLSYDELKDLNPLYRTDFVPATDQRPLWIRVPQGRRDIAVAALDDSRVSQPRVVRRDDYDWHRVRRGDTLSTIARRHRTSVAVLRDMNNLGRRSFLRIGQRLKVPDRGGGPPQRATSAAARSRNTARALPAGASGRTIKHVVAPGENLTTIARRYGTTVQALLKLNSLGRRSVLRAGQVLRVPSATSAGDDSVA